MLFTTKTNTNRTKDNQLKVNFNFKRRRLIKTKMKDIKICSKWLSCESYSEQKNILKKNTQNVYIDYFLTSAN